MANQSLAQQEESGQDSTSQKGRSREISIVDQFYIFKKVLSSLLLLWDNMRNTDIVEFDSLMAWQDMVDMALDFNIKQMNEALQQLADKFEDLEFNPVKINHYSLLRSSED